MPHKDPARRRLYQQAYGAKRRATRRADKALRAYERMRIRAYASSDRRAAACRDRLAELAPDGDIYALRERLKEVALLMRREADELLKDAT